MSRIMKNEAIVFLPGQVIYQVGDVSNSIFLIKEGKVELLCERDGVEVVLATLQSGDMFGYETLFTKEARQHTARAATQVVMAALENDSVLQHLKSAAPYICALLKNSLMRVRQVEELFLEAKLKEKKLLRQVGTIFHHAAQIAYLFVALAKRSSIEADGIILFPLKGFIAEAEHVILRRSEYLQSIFDAMTKGGLFKVIEDKKYGLCVQNPRIQLLEDFSFFTRRIAKEGTQNFVPVKFHPWMSALVRIYKRYPDRSEWHRKDLVELLGRDLGRRVSESIIVDLMSFQLVKEKSPTEDIVMFNAQSIQRRLIFENTCRLISEIHAE